MQNTIKKTLIAMAITVAIATISFADTVVGTSEDLYIGKILKIGASSVLIQTGKKSKLLALNEVKGFARDGDKILLVKNNGEKMAGYYRGVNDKEIIVQVNNKMVSVNITEIAHISPYTSSLFAYTEVGVKNGLMIASYSGINQKIATISTGSNLPSVGYVVGFYVDSKIALSGKIGIMLGGAVSYIPSVSTMLVSSSVEYATLYADSVKVELPVGVGYAITPSLEVALNIAPSFNITSVYQTATVAAVDPVYITHLTIGLKPSLDIKYRIADLISVGLSVGYEALATCDGMVLEFKTGIVY